MTTNKAPYIVPLFPLYLPSGSPAALCRVYVYLSGTYTPTTCYTDAAGDNPAAYQTCDSTGRVNVWLDAGVAIRVVVKDATGTNNIWGPIDGVYGSITAPTVPGAGTVALSNFQNARTGELLGFDANGNAIPVVVDSPLSIASNTLGYSSAVDARVLLAQATTSTNGVVAYNNTLITSTYSTYEIELYTSQIAYITLSANNGSTVLSGSSFTGIHLIMGSGFTNIGCASDTGLAANSFANGKAGLQCIGYDCNNSALGHYIGNSSDVWGGRSVIKIRVLYPMDATRKTRIIIYNPIQVCSLSGTDHAAFTFFSGYNITAEADNYIALTVSGSSHSVESYLYGIK